MRRLAHIHHKINKDSEPIWHVQLAIIIVIILQLVIDTQLTIRPKYLVAFVELLLLIVLMVVAQTSASLRIRRTFAILLTALITMGNVISLFLVCYSLFNDHGIDGKGLLFSAAAIYLTNIIIFGLWYWELEYKREDKPVDFLFPNENAPEHTGLHKTGWRPSFFDYLYISTTNATAFSPTDTLPLTHRAKALMSVQSLISLVIVVLVTARAVSIIG
jgi:uncharacterized membrane protein